MAAVPWERHPHRLHSRSSSGWSSRGSGSLSPPSPTSLCAPRPVRCFRVLYIYDGPLHPGDAFYDAVKEKVECQLFSVYNICMDYPPSSCRGNAFSFFLFPN